MAKDKKKNKDMQIPDSMQEEMFVHRFLWDLGADEEETIAYIKILKKMAKEIVGEVSARIDERMRTQNRIIGWGLTFLGVLIAFFGLLDFLKD